MPSEVRIGIVGAGYWGPNLIRNFLALEGVVVAGIADRRPGRLQFVREKFGAVPTVAEGELLLHDPSIDAIALATPVSTHAELAIDAIRHGKHVFIEKPMARSVAECDAILKAALSHDRRVAVGHIFVHHPAVVAMREHLAEGRIGRPCYYESARVNLGPPESEVSVLWDLLVHDLSILLDLTGGKARTVAAFGRNFIHPRLVDAAFVNVTLEDGTMSQHHVSWLSPEKVRRFFVAGTKGSLNFDDALPSDKLRFVDQGVDSRLTNKAEDAKELYYRPGEVRQLEYRALEPLAEECADFIAAVRGGTRPRSDGEMGRAVVAVLEAAERSLAGGSATVAVGL